MKHLSRDLSISMLALGAIFSASSAGAMAITDGDFDSLPLTLSPGSGSVDVGDWTLSNFGRIVARPGGGNMVGLEAAGGNSSDPTAAQTVDELTIGATYTLAWDYALRVNFSRSGNGPSFGVFLDTQTFLTALFLDTYLVSTFKAESVDFIATSTSHTFIFAGELDQESNGALGTDVSYNLDNVSLSGGPATGGTIPEPAGLAVFAGGLLALGAIRRRRRG